MYFHISFNTWLNFTRKSQRRERHYQKEEKRRMKCIQQNKVYTPLDFQDEKDQLIDVSIEIEEIVYYTSDEEEELNQ